MRDFARFPFSQLRKSGSVFDIKVAPAIFASNSCLTLVRICRLGVHPCDFRPLGWWLDVRAPRKTGQPFEQRCICAFGAIGACGPRILLDLGYVCATFVLNILIGNITKTLSALPLSGGLSLSLGPRRL